MARLTYSSVADGCLSREYVLADSQGFSEHIPCSSLMVLHRDSASNKRLAQERLLHCHRRCYLFGYVGRTKLVQIWVVLTRVTKNWSRSCIALALDKVAVPQASSRAGRPRSQPQPTSNKSAEWSILGNPTESASLRQKA